jgi:hypothetical protein
LTQRGYPWAAVSLLVIGEVLRGPLGATAAADELVLPQAVERKQSVELVYRFDKAVTGHGFLEVEWTDVDSRVIERRRMPLDLADTTEVAFVLDTRRAVTMKNRLAAHSSIDAVDQLGNKFHRENNKTESFIASPSDPPMVGLSNHHVAAADPSRVRRFEVAWGHGRNGSPLAALSN